jgi:hypothetical protein
MKKLKPKAHKTALDRIAAKLRTALRRETTNTIEIGDILIESRKLFANEHGEWLPWLEENFDLSIRTAQRYIAAAEYAARQMRHGVSRFSNLSPTLLYALAAGQYDEQEETAILAATRTGRVDLTRATAICDELAPPPVEESDQSDDASELVEATEDSEIAAILDGPPPEVPPPAPNITPDFTLGALDQAVSALKQLMTKPAARFASSVHANDLEGVESFIRAVADRAREAAATADARPRLRGDIPAALKPACSPGSSLPSLDESRAEIVNLIQVRATKIARSVSK